MIVLLVLSLIAAASVGIDASIGSQAIRLSPAALVVVIAAWQTMRSRHSLLASLFTQQSPGSK